MKANINQCSIRLATGIFKLRNFALFGTTRTKMVDSTNNIHSLDDSNWGFVHYGTKNIRAFISIGGVPAADDDGEICCKYYVTTSDHELKTEYFQKSFDDLSLALNFINQRYGHWEIIDLRRSNSGCSSCSAKDS